MKSLFHSKTFWTAVAQAVAGIGVAVFTQYGLVGEVVILKSILDVVLRLITTEPVANPLAK